LIWRGQDKNLRVRAAVVQPEGPGGRRGIIGTGGFDIEALANAGVPATVVGASEEATLDDPDSLMDAGVKAANLPAVQRRVEIGMPGREAPNRM
jgi:hypothetical protein